MSTSRSRSRGRSGKRGYSASPPTLVKRRQSVRKRRLTTAIGRALSTHQLEKYNVEVKSREFPISGAVITTNTASTSNGPKNSVVVPCGMYAYNANPTEAQLLATGLKQGNDCEEIQGCWITEAYPSVIRWRVSFNNLATVAGIYPSVSVRVIHGIYKNTLQKMDAPQITVPGAIDHALDEIKAELFASSISSDHLEFPERNRRLKILSDKRLYPMDNQLVTNTETAYKNPPPPLEGIFRFPHHALKQKLVKVTTPGNTTDGAPLPEMCPFFSWIPFTVFMCDELQRDADGNAQVLDVSYATKYYFRDV